MPVLRDLQMFFMGEYMVKGEEGLPVEVKDGDQHREPADFIAFVKQAYAAKPAN